MNKNPSESTTEKRLVFAMLYINATLCLMAILLALTAGLEFAALQWMEGVLSGATLVQENPVLAGASNDYLVRVSLVLAVSISGGLFAVYNDRIRAFINDSHLNQD